MAVADDDARQVEAALIQQIAQQDSAALATLYDRYSRIIYAIALRSLRSAEESEEVVLDVFAQVWRIAERYDSTKSRVDTWLFMMTRSRVLDRLRKRQRRIQSVGEPFESMATQVADGNITPLESAVIQERREQVIMALAALPPEQRSVLELAYYDGLSHSEIAAQTGISLGTVKTRIRLGLNKLRSRLEAN
ncbi:MAG: polymerase sigma factor SigK [Cyanobacteriota bacterium]|jgi:RNA polymerase sigma-70 factor, ECF subfamily